MSCNQGLLFVTSTDLLGWDFPFLSASHTLEYLSSHILFSWDDNSEENVKMFLFILVNEHGVTDELLMNELANTVMP